MTTLVHPGGLAPAAPVRRRVRRLGVVLMAFLVAGLALAVGVVAWRANEPALVSTLSAPADDGGGAVFKARLEPRRHRVMLTPVGAFERAGGRHARQLWLMRAYGPPQPLGVIDADRTTVLPFANTLLAEGNPATDLFVSLERPGGSRAGFPEGRTVAQGALSAR